MSISYKDSGVDKEEGYRLVDAAKNAAGETHNANVLNSIGSFASLYALGDYEQPVLVSGTDGVGTKLAVAFAQNRYDTVGIDCVAMCANDILCHGAQPLFFLDYIGCGKLDAQQAADIVSGVANGCKQAQCALVGGETAEMPGFYKVGDYDIAGFCVGVVERDHIVDGTRIQAGDAVIGLASSGVHSNGFSLVRRLFPDLAEPFADSDIGEILLTPTKIYVNAVLALLKDFDIRGMAHITGGGLIENLPRTLPEGLCANIDKNAINIPEIFQAIQSRGVAETEMWSTFNMGVGFTLVVPEAQADDFITSANELGERAFKIGHIAANTENNILLMD